MSKQNTPLLSSLKTPTFQPGAHGRNLSSATGVDTPAVEDFLPPGTTGNKDADPLTKRFSKRGVRLAVHSSIMDLNAHEIPDSLKKRWIHKARFRQKGRLFAAGSLSSAQLSKISEVTSVTSGEHRRGPSHSTDGARDENDNDKRSELSSTDELPTAHVSKAKKRGLTLLATPVGQTLGKLITKLSSTSLRENRDANSAPKKTKDSDKSGWTYKLTKPFEKSELTTPDYNQDIENMVLR